ncbi:putative membrane-bound dehydrogenase-like protein [Algoriphagus aquaeductus]|uniref:Putative membrane-bound dehydrogenase-like protein n=1 Tax=Algoriphagus aquaeductus TaxID=475299 RepID=A0A326RV03_9BACT|nr:HEAT repeat domain-containing protein [Algoriphagus aquaeductus]PZV80275.1 putative membrane-bound dehydrogenase-like protein [Algoriphagus aquaeductus]
MLKPNFKPILLSSLAFFSLGMFFSCKKAEPVDLQIITLTPEEIAPQAEAARNSINPVMAEGLKMDLWAVDSLVKDPIAIQVYDDGSIYYTRSPRRSNSEFDIRGHQSWEIRSIALQTIEDKRNFLRTELSPERSSENTWLADLNGDGSHDWRDMTVERNEIFKIKDTDGDGLADWAQRQVNDFYDEVVDVAGGLLKTEDALYVAAGPDMWRLMDKNGDGIMDEKQSLSHGYGIHIGFGGHGMSGVEMGPDGRIYWGIGDIGFNGKGDDGTEYKYPNRGVIARSNPDGSDFEIFAMGVRNTHEFVFDQFTNLISVDNDGDHAGEKERLVYLTRGSDSGWRINWQFGKYRDPDNNTYKVWMDEKLYLPRWEGQAAYITPPLMNYVSGPTGMVFNPGAGLGPRWKDHFFVVEFVGSAASSGIHAFQLQPKGASFEMTKTEKIVGSFLPTGIDFGPDGALYAADWVNGWEDKYYGRIWKLTDETAAGWALQKQTAEEIKADYKKLTESDLKSRLYFEDMRIRRKAQFELAKRGQKGASVFEEVIQDQSNPVARVHGIVGLTQLARMEKRAYADAIVPLLKDQDPEIVAQAAKWLGDIRYEKANPDLIANLKHSNARVQFFSAEALGRSKAKEAIQPLIALLEANNDQDAYLRHGVTYALSQIGQVEPLAALSSHPSNAVRLGAVLALRRLESPELSKFLQDSDEYIVTEVARAIHDDFSVEAALPALGALLATTSFQNEPLIRRAISANQRVGKDENLNHLLVYLGKSNTPEILRKEALGAIGTWAKPSLVDRVDGRYRGEVQRDAALIRDKVKLVLIAAVSDRGEQIRAEAIKAIGKLEIQDAADLLLAKLKSDPADPVKIQALNSLVAMNSANLSEAITQAMGDNSQSVRVAGLGLLAQTNLPKDQKVTLLTEIIQKRTVPEKQTAITTLATLEASKDLPVWKMVLGEFEKGKLPEGTWIELEEAIEATGSPELKAEFADLLAKKAGGEEWRKYAGALADGSVRRGRTIFFENQTAQCIRCHAYDDMGGNAGPALDGIGNTLSKEELLIALVEPSKRLAPGYGTISIELNSGEKVTGTLMDDGKESVKVKVGAEEKIFPRKDIKTSQIAPSSMPPMGTLLTKREIRDLVSYLSVLRRRE